MDKNHFNSSMKGKAYIKKPKMEQPEEVVPVLVEEADKPEVGGASGRNVRVFTLALANFGESWREAMSLYRRKVDGKRPGASP
jgi:hypothetical protein